MEEIGLVGWLVEEEENVTAGRERRGKGRHEVEDVMTARDMKPVVVRIKRGSDGGRRLAVDTPEGKEPDASRCSLHPAAASTGWSQLKSAKSRGFVGSFLF